MTLSVGDRIPDVTLMRMTGEGPAPVGSGEALGSGTVVLFGVPGAFTPTCSDHHLPGYVRRADELLAKGVDTVACIAVNDVFVLGGDCFALIAKPGRKKLIALSACGRAPTAATPEWYAGQGLKRIETTSVHAVTVPGAIDGWCRLVADHGSLPLDRLLAPAIALAEGGFVVAPRVAADWAAAARKGKLKGAGARKHLLNKDGKAPKAGEVWRFPGARQDAEGHRRQGPRGLLRRRGGGRHRRRVEGTRRPADARGLRRPVLDLRRSDLGYDRGVELQRLPPTSDGIVA